MATITGGDGFASGVAVVEVAEFGAHPARSATLSTQLSDNRENIFTASHLSACQYCPFVASDKPDH